MTHTDTLTPDEIRTAGMKALVKELGPAGAIRFLQLFHTNGGDYTAERREWMDTLSREEFLRDLESFQHNA